MKEGRQCLLAPFRVLDLTEGGCLIAGKILGDLGADVIKIEPPGGSPSRRICPFHGNTPDPEKSLFWFAYNTNKRSITIDLQSDEGKDTFKGLVSSADFVLESFEPEYMDSLGLGYEILSKINPRIIMTSITPYGGSGPYARYKASELTIWAMGGFMGGTGLRDRSPMWVSFPQASLRAGNYTAMASLIAHWHREKTGEGQHIDVSTQQCVLLGIWPSPQRWEFLKIERAPRIGPQLSFPRPNTSANFVYPCKDGEVIISLIGGGNAAFYTSSGNLVKYMAENNMASDWLKKFDWITEYDALKVTQDVIERVQGEVSNFLLTKTKKELYEEALKRRILMAPIADARNVYENSQLQARDFWVDVEHPELGKRVTYCGPFIKLSEAPIEIRHRPPLIGEHNEEICQELGVSKEKPSLGKQGGGTKKEEVGVGKQALEGIKVVDFTWSIVGPLTAKHLGDHGATVVRVESHTRPGTMRMSGPYKDDVTGPDRSCAFSLLNTSKYGMSLNLQKEKGREVARRLIMWADVVIESFTPGAMERMGLDYETMSKERPDIIYLSTSCYGQYGPHAKSPGYGQMASALSGIYNMIGWPDRPTDTNISPHTDFISPPLLVSAIMAALDYRRRTGKGLYLEQSQTEAGVHFFAPLVMDYIINKRIAKRDGNHNPYAAPHGVYPCRGDDRWCAIAVFTDEEWKRFCDVMGNPQWTRDAKFVTFGERKENEEELDRLVGEWTVNFTPEELMSLLQEREIDAGVVRTLRELYEDPQIEYLGFWRYLDHPVIGVHAHQGPPFQLSKTPDGQFTSPCMGQHNEYVYKELLGFSDDEVAQLLIEGVITTEADLPEFRPLM